MFQGKYDEAESFFARATEILEKSLGPEHLDVAATLNHRAELFTRQVMICILNIIGYL